MSLSLASSTAEGVSYASRKPRMVFLMTVPPVVRLQCKAHLCHMAQGKQRLSSLTFSR